MSFNNCQGPCTDLAAPDTIIVPPGAPLAGPNSVMGVMKIPGQFTVFMNTACLAHNLATRAPASIGPAGGPGVASGLCCGPEAHLMGSTCAIIGGTPATMLGSTTQHNGASPNIVGATIAPCQVTVMTLA